MVWEDFTTYTEFDESAKITVDSASKVSWAALETKYYTGYLYKDKGVNHFDGDFTHKFECQFSSMGNIATSLHWMLSNIIGDEYAVRDQNEDSVIFFSYDDAEHLYLRLTENGVWGAVDFWMPPGPQPSTTYYIEIVRDDDGGANSTGRYTAYIRTGSHSGALQDTLVADSSAGYQKDFRYVYSVATSDSNYVNHGLATGFTQNLDLGEAAATTVAPTTSAPTTTAPTTVSPTTTSVATTPPPTTSAPTTAYPTSAVPTTSVPTSVAPTTLFQTTVGPTTGVPTTLAPTSPVPTTIAPTTSAPTTVSPTSLAPTTVAPTTLASTTLEPTTLAPTTLASTSLAPTTNLPELICVKNLKSTITKEVTLNGNLC